MEVIGDPDVIEHVLQNEDRELNNIPPEHNNCKTLTSDFDVLQKTEAKIQQHSLKLSQVQL